MRKFSDFFNTENFSHILEISKNYAENYEKYFYLKTLNIATKIIQNFEIFNILKGKKSLLFYAWVFSNKKSDFTTRVGLIVIFGYG